MWVAADTVTRRPAAPAPGSLAYAAAMTPEELVASVSPLFASLGGAFYFAPETLARGKELGLDGFRFYILGRGGVLGNVEAAVVQSAFGYFEPGLLAKMWNTGRTRVSPRGVARAYVEQSHEFGRRKFGDVKGLAEFCDAAECVRANTHPAGLALYAGLAAEPLPDDLPARAMQLTSVLRELRGSVHLVAVVASGVSPKVAHYFRRPNDFVMFGYRDDEVPVVTDDDRERLSAADQVTDQRMADHLAVLDDAQRDALLNGARRMTDAVG